MKGLIYQITFDDQHYIGSTIQTIKQRITTHHRAFTKYGFIRDESIIEILEDCDVEDQNELFQIEGRYLSENVCVNQRKAHGLNQKDRDKYYYSAKKEFKIKQSSDYYYLHHELNKQKKKDKHHYVCSWGGDPRFSNNLLSIKL